jgi:uncharacterized protein YajQ (UPF0234 family)
MPSFDTVSEVSKHEVQNAIDQGHRELANRFDFKGIETTLEYDASKNEIKLAAPSDFQLQQLKDIVEAKLVKRGIDTQSLEIGEPDTNVQECRQTIKLKQGIESSVAKKITQLIKDEKYKAQASIQGDKVRVTAKDRDVLQDIMAFLRKQDVGLPLQFDNFRD